MPALTNYRLFISHSWSYRDAYEKLVASFAPHIYGQEAIKEAMEGIAGHMINF